MIPFMWDEWGTHPIRSCIMNLVPFLCLVQVELVEFMLWSILDPGVTKGTLDMISSAIASVVRPRTSHLIS